MPRDTDAAPSGRGRHTTLLIRSSSVAWEGLRHVLKATACIEIVGEVRDADRAAVLAGQMHPELIISSAVVAGSVSVTELVRALRARSPSSRIIVMVDHLDQVRPHELLELQGLGLEAQLLWSEVTANRFHRCVLTILEDGLVVASRQVAEAFLDTLRHRGGPTSPAAVHAAATGSPQRACTGPNA